MNPDKIIYLICGLTGFGFHLNGISGDRNFVAVDEEDSADVEDLVVAELVRLQAEELTHHAQHRSLVLVKSEIKFQGINRWTQGNGRWYLVYP